MLAIIFLAQYYRSPGDVYRFIEVLLTYLTN